jgi:hypothetical protein
VELFENQFNVLLASFSGEGKFDYFISKWFDFDKNPYLSAIKN